MNPVTRWWLITLSLATLTIFLGYLLLSPIIAQAQVVIDPRPIEQFQVQAPPRVLEEVAIAETFFSQRGVLNPCPTLKPSVYITDVLTPAPPGYIVLGEVIGGVCGTIHIRTLTPTVRFMGFIEECTTVVHEYGHYLGLAHTADKDRGIMAPIHSRASYECKLFARRHRARQTRARHLKPDPAPNPAPNHV